MKTAAKDNLDQGDGRGSLSSLIFSWFFEDLDALVEAQNIVVLPL